MLMGHEWVIIPKPIIFNIANVKLTSTLRVRETDLIDGFTECITLKKYTMQLKINSFIFPSTKLAHIL